MTPQQRIVLAAIDAVNTGDRRRVEGFVTAELIETELIETEMCGVRYEVHDVFGSGDRVAVRTTARGVHNRDRLGFAATGRPFAVSTLHICRVEGGVVAQHWSLWDEVDLLRQVGALR